MSPSAQCSSLTHPFSFAFQVAMLNLYHLHVSLVPGQNDRTRSVREEGACQSHLTAASRTVA